MAKAQTGHREKGIFGLLQIYSRTAIPMSALLNNKLRQARNLLQIGDAAGALAVCAEILAKAPRNPEALTLRGIAALMGGTPADAARDFRQALVAAPGDGAILEYLGLALLHLGAFAEAEQSLQRASAIRGAPASVWMRLGIAVLRQGRAQEALIPLQRAITMAPNDTDCLLSLGQAMGAAGDTAGAEEQFSAILAAVPGHPDALFNMGVLEMEAKHFAAAAQWFDRVLGVRPQHPDALINLGVIAEQNQDSQQALELFRQAVTANPGNTQALTKLGNALARSGQHALAYRHLQAAAGQQPKFIEALEGLAHTCAALGRFKEAAAHCEQALLLEPENPALSAALASAQLQQGDLDGAQRRAEQAIRVDPKRPAPYQVLADVLFFRKSPAAAIEILEQGYAQTGDGTLLGMLAAELRRTCQWDKWSRIWPEIHARLDSKTALGGPFALLAQPTTAGQQLAYARRWASRFFVHAAAIPGTQRAVSAGRRCRIGYLSSDFHEHATAYLMAELLELHDRTTFEIFAYSYGPEDHSAMRTRLRAACEHFIDIAWDPDDIAARRISDDQLDILVDLKGYTMGSRTALLAARPCAIQINWLGYPGTMGADFIDYVIADPVIIPPDMEKFFTERILRLPHTYQPNDRHRAVADALSRLEYGLPENAFVFCCFNQAFKISPEIFACWMRILRHFDTAVLWLLEDNPIATQNLRAAAIAQNVAPERLVMAPHLPLPQHLARYRVADLALDTFPYTSHTTASDALWGGCPLVALCGETFPARVSASILTACGVADLITDSIATYEQKIRELAASPETLKHIQTRIISAHDSAPLFNALAFTRSLEALFLDLHAGTAGDHP